MIVDVSITGPDADWLAEHARSLIDARLAACGNIVPSIRSVYRWNDEVLDEPEALLVLHTRDTLIDAIIERTNAEHPYETVQVVARELIVTDDDYRNWILASTAPPSRTTSEG